MVVVYNFYAITFHYITLPYPPQIGMATWAMGDWYTAQTVAWTLDTVWGPNVARDCDDIMQEQDTETSVQNSATFPTLLLISSKKVVFLSEKSSK